MVIAEEKSRQRETKGHRTEHGLQALGKWFSGFCFFGFLFAYLFIHLFAVLGMESRLLGMLVKHSATNVPPVPFTSV